MAASAASRRARAAPAGPRTPGAGTAATRRLPAAPRPRPRPGRAPRRQDTPGRRAAAGLLASASTSPTLLETLSVSYYTGTTPARRPRPLRRRRAQPAPGSAAVATPVPACAGPPDAGIPPPRAATARPVRLPLRGACGIIEALWASPSPSGGSRASLSAKLAGPAEVRILEPPRAPRRPLD